MGTEWLELSALYLKKKKKKTVIFDFVYTKSIICKYRPVSTKLGQNIYIQQILNEFNHGSNALEQLELFVFELGKLLHSALFTL